MRPDAETDRVADDCREARRDRRNDRHGNASMDGRTRVTWCGSGLALRQPGSSIRTDQTNLAAGRPAAPLRAKTAAFVAVRRTTEPFSSPLTDRAGSAVRRVGKSRLADCQERPRRPARTRGPGVGARIRETVFGRDAGHGWGDDHVARACDAIGSRPRNRRRRTPRAAGPHENPASGAARSGASAGCDRAGRQLGWPERELDLGPGGAGGPGRGPGHGKAAGPEPPDVVLGVWLPFPLPATRAPPPASGGASPLTAQSVRRRRRPSRPSAPGAGRTGRCAGRPLPRGRS